MIRRTAHIVTNGQSAPTSVLMTVQTHRSAWNSSLELVRALVTAGARVSLGLVGAALASDQRRELRRLKGVDVVHEKDGKVLVARSALQRNRLGALLLCEAYRINARVIHLDGISHLDLPWGRPTVVSLRTS